MYRTLIQSKLAEQNILLDAAKEEKRGLTEDEQTKFNALQAEIKSLTATAQAAKDAEETQGKLNTPVNTPLYAQPKKQADDKPFNSFGEQMRAIIIAGQPGGVVDQRLLSIQNAASGANEGVPSDGGFLVQKDFAAEILKTSFETGLVAPRCRRIPISANSNGIKLNGVNETSRAAGSRWGGVLGYWADEAATVTATKPKFRQIELNLNKLMAIYYATDELLQDAAASESVLTQAFADEIKFKLDDAIINGTGAGQPLGIMAAPCLVTVAKETGQGADTILFENIVKMWSRLIATSRGNAVWYINQDVEPELYGMSLSIGTGGIPVYLPANGLSGSMYGTLFGRPVIPIEQCDTIGDLGDIVLADMSQYLLADKNAPQTASSIHVKFLYDETAFRITYRVDGQPILGSAITPYKSSNTLSPFVTLAARA